MKSSKKALVILDAAGIATAITSIVKRGASLDQLIQQTAVSVVDHIEKHGDITLANRLQVSMPKGSRSNALAAFLLATGKIKVRVMPENATKAMKDAFKDQPFEFNRDGKTDMEKALGTPWYEFKKPKSIEQEFGVKELSAGILRLVLQVDKAIVASGLSANDPMVVQLKALSALAAKQ